MIACVTSAPTAVWITIACAWSRSSTTTPRHAVERTHGGERIVPDPVDLDLDDRALADACLEVARRSLGHDLALRDDGDAVAELVRLEHVVRRQQHGLAGVAEARRSSSGARGRRPGRRRSTARRGTRRAGRGGCRARCAAAAASRGSSPRRAPSRGRRARRARAARGSARAAPSGRRRRARRSSAGCRARRAARRARGRRRRRSRCAAAPTSHP